MPDVHVVSISLKSSAASWISLVHLPNNMPKLFSFELRSFFKI